MDQPSASGDPLELPAGNETATFGTDGMPLVAGEDTESADAVQRSLSVSKDVVGSSSVDLTSEGN